MQTLSESMKEAETRKRSLEEDVDALREECAKLKAAEQVQAVTNKEKAEEKEAATKMRVALEEQMDQLRDAHQKQVDYLWNTFQLNIDWIFNYLFLGLIAHFLIRLNFLTLDLTLFKVAALRDELSEKQELISELKDLNQKFTLAHQQMQADYERLKQEEANKSVKLQELMLLNERREQVRLIEKFMRRTSDPSIIVKRNYNCVKLISGEERSQGFGGHSSQRTADPAQSAQIVRPGSAS